MAAEALEQSALEGKDKDQLLQIAKALGVAGAKEGEGVPNLAGAVKDLKKRIDDLENTPGSRTSLDEQDDETGEGRKGKGKVWKGLL